MGVLKERGNKQAVLVFLASWKVLNCSNAAGAFAEHTALGNQLSLSHWWTVSLWVQSTHFTNIGTYEPGAPEPLAGFLHYIMFLYVRLIMEYFMGLLVLCLYDTMTDFFFFYSFFPKPIKNYRINKPIVCKSESHEIHMTPGGEVLWKSLSYSEIH